MAGETRITVIGNLTADPEINYTQGGDGVANFTIASTTRQLDKTTNEWKDTDTLFLRASVWREYADHVAQSLTKGMRVIATGRLKMKQYETREGEKRTDLVLEVDEIGPSLRNAIATVRRANGDQRTLDRAQPPQNRPSAPPARPQEDYVPGQWNEETPF